MQGMLRMDTRYLEFFLECARTGSLTGAAKKLIMTQQGLSAAIHRLEEELKCQLFRRTATGIELTDDGSFFLPMAKKILTTLGECRLKFSGEGQAERVAVGCTYGVVGILWERVLTEFQNSNPDVELMIHEFPDLGCERALESGEVDLAVFCGPVDNTRFAATPLIKSLIQLIVPQAHRFARQDTIAVSQLRSVPIVMLNRNFRIYGRFMELCGEEGFRPIIVNEAAEIMLVYKLVEKGAGVGLSPAFVCDDIPSSSIRAVPIDHPDFSWEIYLVTRKADTLSGAAERFAQHVVSCRGDIS